MAIRTAGETGHSQAGCSLVVAGSGDGGGGSGTAMETALSQSTGARARQSWYKANPRHERQWVTGGRAGCNQGSATGGSGGGRRFEMKTFGPPPPLFIKLLGS